MMCQVIAVTLAHLSHSFRSKLCSISAYLINDKALTRAVLEEVHVYHVHVYLLSQASVNFTLKLVRSGEKTHKIEALVLHKIALNIPSCSAALVKNGRI